VKAQTWKTRKEHLSDLGRRFIFFFSASINALTKNFYRLSAAKLRTSTLFSRVQRDVTHHQERPAVHSLIISDSPQLWSRNSRVLSDFPSVEFSVMITAAAARYLRVKNKIYICAAFSWCVCTEDKFNAHSIFLLK